MSEAHAVREARVELGAGELDGGQGRGEGRELVDVLAAFLYEDGGVLDELCVPNGEEIGVGVACA